ncbi:hypothetical protein D9Q98_002127 [Chlorella vulgaris]|uniref:General transcription and DNA repair factor IIH subunit TFB4 n=1 Tax=Chlorella vulgaris TaxID=3077 RepID=A0A9D4TVV4_CHLVU|nr:hypothetical protein D9Q98_002127 [Chlorella vulgaris]
MAEFADDSSLLAILLDVSPSAVVHLASTPGLSLQTLLEQLLIFVNAFSLLNDGNRLAVFTAGPSGCQLAYCSSSCLPPAAAAEAAAERGTAPSAEVLKGLWQAIAGTAAAEKAGGGTFAGTSCQFSSALSRMLCFINSLQCRAAAAAAGAELSGGAGPSGGASAAVRKQQPMRLLCLTAAPDVPSQYIAVMNSIFSAQRSGVLIDACQLGVGDSSFLQQAAHLTGGIYLKPDKPQALLQYLNSVFSLDASTRQYLRLPGNTRVDFRASCFCHKRQIDLGFVCSACLSIFCEQLPACLTCGTDFQGGQGKK